MPWLDWISLFVRWFHVIAGVAWIGASFYFIWLDNNLEEPPAEKKQKGIKGDLWAIHGGGFYEVAKYAYGPEKMPQNLHWFKWEAYTTWISGFALLILVYYLSASAFLIDPSVMQLTEGQAIGAGLGIIFGGLALYELACRSALAKSQLAFAIFLVLLLCIIAYVSAHLFSGRGAYIHMGALVGTIMAGNVFFQIMPSQRKMVAAVAAKQEIDPAWGAGAKLRSVHNNYLTLPLLFIMISNHYPMTYQHELNWLVLMLIMAVSAWIRHYFNLKHLGINKPSILVSGAIAMLAIAAWISWPQSQIQSTVSDENEGAILAYTDQQVMSLVETHCQSCHSSNPSDEIFKIAPLGVVFNDWDDIQRQKNQLLHRTTVTKDMPFLNKTQMTDIERQRLALWGQAK
ncbi:urate hydroxylase PuuD [Glaciecola sp. 1036]|uniref:urate hydroxylase PuuD n=1 Tax=Alteromonadaceae TaxID=72275 RepID=UPI003D04AEE5